MHKFSKNFKRFSALCLALGIASSATLFPAAEEYFEFPEINLLSSEDTDIISRINALKSLILNSKSYYELDYDVFDYCALKHEALYQGNENPDVTSEPVNSDNTDTVSETEIIIETEIPEETTVLETTAPVVPETTAPPPVTTEETTVTTARQPKPNVSYLNFGIDVSSHQGNIDWNAVKNDGVDFAILRAGYGNLKSQIDKSFETNYAACKSQGIPVGAYWYSYADSVADAEREAETFLYAIQGKSFEYPVYFDIEDASQRNFNRQLLTDITIAFCSRLESAGYYVGIYTNVYWNDNLLYQAQLVDYDKWLAHWAEYPKYGNAFGGMWQFGSYGTQAQFDNGQATMLGKINGISAACDVNVCYRNYPNIIKSNHLNGY